MTTPVRTVLTLLAGVIAGALGMALLAGTAPADATLTRTTVHLEDLPAGTVTVTAESVRLATGFTSTHRHGGPTINLVRGGRVEIADRGGTRGYGRGDAFVEPGGRVHTITVADDAAIDVVRILPAGAAATTEVTDAAR
jgi:quercetin dioxygenase-like cupin family protein